MQRIRGKGGPGGAVPADGALRKEAGRFMMEDPEDKPIGQTVLERSQIVHKMGQGGMGGVYQAYDTKDDRTVAFKVISEELAARPEMLARFGREAKALAKISHPNVVEVLDMAHFGNKAYITMEFLQGTDLGGILRPRKGKATVPLSWERAKPIMMQVCDALAAAHDQDILHRDLKPANIFIVKKEGKDFVKVLDFGLAKFKEETDGPNGHETQLTQTGFFLGTPSYGSPEQAMGKKDYDQRSDIYSLGVVMFELLTGRVPFRGENARQTFQMIINDPPPSPRELNPSIPASVEEVIFRAMAKKPADRFQTIREMRDAIARSHGEASGETAGTSDEFNQGAYEDDSGSGEPQRSRIIPSGSSAASEETEREDAVEQYLEKRRPSALGRLLKTAVVVSAIGAASFAVYQYRGQIQRYAKEISTPHPAHSTAPQNPSPPPSAAVETGRHIDILITPNGLQVFTPNRAGHRGRYLGMTPLQNVRLEDGENELLIWRGRSTMSIRLGSDQTAVSGAFRAAGGGAVRNRAPADQSQTGGTD